MQIKHIALLASSILLSSLAFANDTKNIDKELTDDEIRQLFIVTDTLNIQQGAKYGGVVLFKQYFEKMNNACSLKAKYPFLTIFTDQEGGEVIRVKENAPPSAKEARNMPLNEYRKKVELAAKSLNRACVDVNLAPVVELNQYDNRSYGKDFESTKNLATIFTQSMQKFGVKTINKHFPGQTNDCKYVKDLSHIGFKIKENSEALSCTIENEKQFEKNSQLFTTVPSNGIMVSSTIFPQYSPYPSLLNPHMNIWLTKKIKYQGIIISDALWEIEATPLTIIRAMKTVDWVMVGEGKSVELAIPTIRTAVLKGYFTNEELRNKLQKIQQFKDMKLP